MLTIRRTVADGVRMCTGALAPSRMGPIVTPWPPVIFSTLNRMLAASRFGQISTLAAPLSVESGSSVSRSSSLNAASPCSSPSAATSGMRSTNRSRAARIFFADGRWLLPNIECDRNATCGTRPKRRTSATDSAAMSASCSAVGSSLTEVSAMKRVCLSSSSALTVAKPCAPGCRPTTSRRCAKCPSKRPTRPHSSASASPRCTISAAMVVLERRTVALAMSGVTPSRAFSR